jgi:20S proteasome alpha/beta subunit
MQNQKQYLNEELSEPWNSIGNGTQAKLAINNLIWQYGNPKLTLHDAEDLAVEFWSKLMEAKIL